MFDDVLKSYQLPNEARSYQTVLPFPLYAATPAVWLQR